MSGKVDVAFGPEALSIDELCELGQRLSADVLRDLGFLGAIEQAERECWWRLKTAAKMLEPLEGHCSGELARRAAKAMDQVQDPVRGSATVKRLSSQSRGRRLPPAGSVITKRHRFRRGNVPPDVDSRTCRFRFVVIHPRGRLILFGDSRDVVHGSPSGAAKAATRNRAAQGWTFFGVK